MKTVLITGANGFIARNLIAAIQRRDDWKFTTFTSNDSQDLLNDRIGEADLIFHLAGANRPNDDDDFKRVNADLTGRIVEQLSKLKHETPIVFSSSIQAERDNLYGRSKLDAETHLLNYQQQTGRAVSIYRLPNVFGKWSRPNHNTVVATFCHNIARELPITLSDRSHELHLVYIDEVVRCFMRHLDSAFESSSVASVDETFKITLGDLADKLQTIHGIRGSLQVPDLSDRLTKYLYSTYLSFLPEDKFAGEVLLRTDDRGWLFELIKSKQFGQIFVSETKPGITRGNHYHNTKIEKFCLIKGEGVIRFRQLNQDEIIEYPVSDQTIQVVDIPPGFTHSIENTGSDSMIVLFWANEIFDPNAPDTYWEEVIKP
ncbi:NAD-dependent epimerase/dehydratase family protein [Novipirellula sp. SH528]|uniref:polysaccharide biosynthesis C-terminal domain-containing protein n=1 Tax=Novipirellula sp. SH528 TaxID=3454466 RepID=UPI003FA09ECA